MIRVFLFIGVLALLLAGLSFNVTACDRACCKGNDGSGVAFGSVASLVGHGTTWMKHAALTSTKAAPGHLRAIRQQVKAQISSIVKAARDVAVWMRSVMRHVLTEVANSFVQALQSVCSTLSEHVWGHSRS